MNCPNCHGARRWFSADNGQIVTCPVCCDAQGNLRSSPDDSEPMVPNDEQNEDDKPESKYRYGGGTVCGYTNLPPKGFRYWKQWFIHNLPKEEPEYTAH
jgi:hypothetical protein